MAHLSHFSFLFFFKHCDKLILTTCITKWPQALALYQCKKQYLPKRENKYVKGDKEMHKKRNKITLQSV